MEQDPTLRIGAPWSTSANPYVFSTLSFPMNPGLSQSASDLSLTSRTKMCSRIRHHLLSHQMVMGGRYRLTRLPVPLLLGGLLLAAAGRGASEPQAIRRHATSDLGAACAGWLGPSRSSRKSGR